MQVSPADILLSKFSLHKLLESKNIVLAALTLIFSPSYLFVKEQSRGLQIHEPPSEGDNRVYLRHPWYIYVSAGKKLCSFEDCIMS